MFSYREILSVQEYVIVAQKPAHALIYRRSAQGRPQTLDSPDGVLELTSLGLTLPLARLYKGVSRETLP